MKKKAKYNLHFSVLHKEPLTKDERELAKAGIVFDTLPALKRWEARDPRNHVGDVVFVENPVRTLRDTRERYFLNQMERKRRQRNQDLFL